MRQLSPTLSEREVAAVQELTNRLMNKLLHMPMLRLKDAAAAGQGHVYAEAMRFLFDLEENTDENNNRNAGKQARTVSNELDNTTPASALAQS
jgi:glutamyl-tRNA reductase